MTRDEFVHAAFAELRRIERGEATVELAEGDILLGKVSYQTSNGWKLVVFSDGDAWDYIDSITTPTGDQLPLWADEPAHDSEGMVKLRSYHPPGDQVTANGVS
jgi:hypothetical protein